MADLTEVYAELHRRGAVPPEHKPVVDELVRRGVIKTGKFGPGDTLDDGTVLDDQGLERGEILPIARDPNTNTLSLAVPNIVYRPYQVFKRAASTDGELTPAEALDIAGLGMTGGFHRTIASANRPSRIGTALRGDAPARAAEFDAAGIPAFAPALAEPSAGPANRLMEGFFGGPLRAQAQRSIEGVEQGVRDVVGATGGNRPVNEIGSETQDFLRRSVVERNPDIVPENLNPFQLQDISGVGPGPNAPRNAPPVQPTRAEQWNPQRRQVTEEDITRAIQNPPRLETPIPKRLTVEDVILPPQLDRDLSDAKAAAAAAQQWIEANAARHAEMRAQIDEIASQIPRPAPLPRGGFPSYEEAMAQVRAAGKRPISRQDYQKMIDEETARNVAAGQAEPLRRQVDALRSKFDPFDMQMRDAQRTLDRYRALQSEAGTYRSQNLTRAQQAEHERVSTEAQDNYNLRMANARREAEQRANAIADAEHVQNLSDPSRRTAFESRARNAATADTERRQFQADTAYRAELEQRQATAIPDRVGGRSREPYNTEFDAAYEASRRNTPPIQMNPLGRPADTAPTATAQLLDSVAMDYRRQGLLPGYRRGGVFGPDGRMSPEILQIVDSLAGPGVSERIRALSDMRPRGATQLGIQGLDKIKTAIGQALADARQRPIGGMTQGEGASQRARAAFLSRLYDAIGQDIERAVAAAPGGGIAAQQRAVIRQSYQEFMRDIRAPLSRVFGQNVTPEQAVRTLTDAARGGDRGNLDLLRAYYRVADEKGDRLRATGALLNQALDGGLEGFLTWYRGLAPEVRSVMARGDAEPIFTRLDQLARVGGYLERFARSARPDQGVGDVARRAASANSVLTALLAMINAPTAVMMVGGQAAASRAMASRRFREYLVQVPVARDSKQLDATLARLMQIGLTYSGRPDVAPRPRREAVAY